MAFSEGMPASRLFAAALAISALATQLANLSVSPAIAEVAVEMASKIAATATPRLFAAQPLHLLRSGKRVAVRFEFNLSRFLRSKVIAIAHFEIA
jgi:hypothetical protein